MNKIIYLFIFIFFNFETKINFLKLKEFSKKGFDFFKEEIDFVKEKKEKFFFISLFLIYRNIKNNELEEKNKSIGDLNSQLIKEKNKLETVSSSKQQEENKKLKENEETIKSLYNDIASYNEKLGSYQKNFEKILERNEVLADTVRKNEENIHDLLGKNANHILEKIENETLYKKEINRLTQFYEIKINENEAVSERVIKKITEKNEELEKKIIEITIELELLKNSKIEKSKNLKSNKINESAITIFENKENLDSLNINKIIFKLMDIFNKNPYQLNLLNFLNQKQKCTQIINQKQEFLALPYYENASLCKELGTFEKTNKDFKKPEN